MDLATILETVLSPRTNPEARRFAHEQLEIFKTRRDALETCLNLFVQEMAGAKREHLLHFTLRTCFEIAHTKYATLSEAEVQILKNASIAILSRYAMNATPLVEGAAISLAVEILKNDVNHADFFQQIENGLKDPTWSRVACSTICAFSEMLVNEDEESLVQIRRSKLTKFLSSESARLFGTSLDLIQFAFQQQTDPRQMIEALKLAEEVLRWTVPSNTQWERTLNMFAACSDPSLPVAITCAGLAAFKAFAACKTVDLERNGVRVATLYEGVRRCVVLRAVPFRNEQELYAASDALLTAIEKHHLEIHKVTLVQDLQKFTTSGNPFVLQDVLAIWRDLIAIGAIELDDVIVNVILNQCVMCPRSPGDEEEEEDQRGITIKEITKRRPDLACPCALGLITALVASNKTHDAWLLLEAVSNGLTEKHLEMFAVKTPTSPAFVPVLEQILDVVFKGANTPPITQDKLKLVHCAHRLFETRPNYLGMALELFAGMALQLQQLPPTPSGKSKTLGEIRKRAATFLLSVLRRIASKKSESAFSFLSSAILPALVQKVAQAFPTLNGPEKFILLECILVAGKSLPTEAERIQLTRDVLSEPFQVLSTLGLEVMSNLLLELPSGSVRMDQPWDERGYFADIEALPEKSRRVSLALMSLSTCSQDGSLTTDMWQQLIPYAVECLSRLDLLWENWQSPTVQWALIIHPVDVRCMLGGRLAESLEPFLEGLVEYGERMLKPEKMAVVAFLSSVRSCALELLKAATSHTPASTSSSIITKEHCLRLFRSVRTMENRHLAALISCVPLHTISGEMFDQLAFGHILERLRTPLADPCWRVRTFPGCDPALVEDVDDAGRCVLEMAFTRALRACEEMTEQRFICLVERLVYGDDPTIRLAATTIQEKCLPRFPASVLVRTGLKACVASLAKKAPSAEASERAVLDLATETFSRVLFQAPSKEFNRLNRGTGRKKPLAAMTDLNQLFGQARVTAFLDEIYVAKSEKAFKSCVTELLQTVAGEQQQQTGALGAPSSSSASQSQIKKGKKAKKKKRTRGLKDSNGETMRTEDDEEMSGRGQSTKGSAAGSWHEATSARDLGMLLLFNGKGDVDEDDL